MRISQRGHVLTRVFKGIDVLGSAREGTGSVTLVG